MKSFFNNTLMGLFVLAVIVSPVADADPVKAYELLYDEQEAGTDIYRNRYLVTGNYIRIDEADEDSGYILFDNSKNTIYSVSHLDKSTLVIQYEAYERPVVSNNASIEYTQLAEAPMIAGSHVYSYRVVYSADRDNAETCMDIQLAEGLLPEVTTMLSAYQKVVASQQARILKATPEEYRTSCFLYDQVYNVGSYYEKGLPVQEWHSNHRKKLLSGYKAIEVDPVMFTVPENYRQYSLE